MQFENVDFKPVYELMTAIARICGTVEDEDVELSEKHYIIVSDKT